MMTYFEEEEQYLVDADIATRQAINESDQIEKELDDERQED
jgi:hypothetical protein